MLNSVWCICYANAIYAREYILDILCQTVYAWPGVANKLFRIPCLCSASNKSVETYFSEANVADRAKLLSTHYVRNETLKHTHFLCGQNLEFNVKKCQIFIITYLGKLFTESALLADSVIQLPCPSVCLSVCAIEKHPLPVVVETSGQKRIPNIGI